MENLVLEATKSSPSIFFDAEKGVLEIKGKSYPENAAKFFSPVLDWLKEYLASAETGNTVVNMEIIYLNSSSSKAFLNLFDVLESAAKNGQQVVVNWRYHEENETALECGEEFREELQSVIFNLVELSEG
ncbi:MAG: DUF1987 domain-containing protein [Desulfomonile tiedjei]|uniref:DUF1987 domain-containing protein n=1 Tax=Desulfomonile tiedjei TaxID=2358 RepID=A0A9D6UY23_9BACT|nr:DUF1987 domain-containing protein [Desulfomonile tiedjei]